MEAHICEEDLLSGIELLPVTEPNTPENILDESSTSSLSILSDMNSPTKSFHLISPAKLQQSPSEKTPSESASQLQKLLHDSLASSLRKEAELKSKWPASPGEIRLASSIKNHSKTETAVTSKPGNVGPISGAAVYTSLLNKNNLLTVPSNSLHSEDKQALNENNRKSFHFTTPKKSTKGPNICLANQFPSGLSPIKHCPERNSKKHLTVRTSVEDIQLASDDPNTKKLLAFINQLEKGSDNDKSVADQLAQLSILLKNSSAEVGHNEEIGQGDHDGDSFVKQRRKNQTEEVLSKEKVDHSAYQDKISDNMSTEQSLKHIDATQSKTQSSKSNALSGNYFKTSSNKEANSAQNYKIANSVKSRSGRTNQVSKATKDSMAVERTRNEKKEKVKREMDTRKASKSKMTKNAPSQVLKEGAKEQDIRSTTDKIGIESKPLQDMTAVRNHLHGMLNFHKIDPTSLDLSAVDIQNSTHDSKAEDTFHSNDTAILLRAQPKDVLPLSPSKDSSQNLTESLSSGLFGLLKAGQKQPSSGRSSIDSSLAAENEILRDTLEKETYRRKHCEKQIQKLQKKILDIQQELAVANSTDRKKDLMIEQLDKTLAKVVDGWKGHEANLAKSIEQLSLEKESNIEEIVKLKEMVVGLENELAKALEELVEEKERVLHFEEKEKAMQMNYQARTQEISQVIDQKNESLQRLQTKIDKLSEDRTLLKQSMDDIQLEMQDQKKAFITKEEEWEEAIIELEKRHRDELEKEKSQTEQERKRCKEIQSSLSSTQQEVTRLEKLTEAQRTELESMNTQIEVLEAKHQADIRKMEAEHKIDVERQIMEKLSTVHEESHSNEARIREAHKKQVLDLMDGHKRELEAQCHRYEDELHRRDESMRRTLLENEKSLNEKLKSKSEGMRQLMLAKMQNLLQTHYNETLQIVGNTTGVTPQRSTASGSLTHSSMSFPDHSFLNSFGVQGMLSTHARNGDCVTQRQVSNITHSQAVIPPSQLHSNPPSSISSLDLVKPTPSLPIFHKSAFSVAGSVAPSVTVPTLAKPVPGFSQLQSIPVINPDMQLAANTSIEEHEIEEEALPNLSLISSISHSTVASMQQKDRFLQPAPSNVTSNSAPLSAVQAIVNARETYQRTIDLPIEEVAIANSEDATKVSVQQTGEEDVRQLRLQHYVQRLLQRSPGDPLETVDSESPRQSEVMVTSEENKENGVSRIMQMTSHPTAILTQSINPQLKASPDLVPVKQDKSFNDPLRLPGLISMNIEKRPSALSKEKPNELKRCKSNVRFSQESVKDKPAAIAPNPVLDPGLGFTSYLSPAQMSEISQMLGLYSTSTTPSGETRLAAEHLLAYLRDQKTPVGGQSSVQPSVTSSPVADKKAKQVTKSSEKVLNAEAAMKNKVKSGATPTKSLPAWR